MVAIEWAESDLELEDVGDDFDLYVYKGRIDADKSAPNGTPSWSSQTAAVRGTGERVTINDAPEGEYTVRVVYKTVIDAGYSGSASFLEAGVAPPPDPIPPQHCTADHVWFLGTVYDRAQRDDFKKDVRHFEGFLAKLRETYCIPDSQATILAMGKDAAGNNYTDDVLRKSYPEGSEANLKAELRRMGGEADDHPDSLFFFFLSSHGLMWSGAHPESACKDPRRVVGSFAGLKPGGEEDGNLDDCELGDELNNSFSDKTRMLVVVDCSFCGGFSDSLTAVSGSVPDGGAPSSSGLPAPSSSGIPAPNRVVITGCAVTTECFGSAGGGVTYWHMSRVLNGDIPCDGWTAPEFPKIQGLDIPVNGAPFNPPDGRCTASEWFFAAVQSAYQSATEVRGILGIQQQFRIKYGFETLREDLLISSEDTRENPDPDPSSSASPSPSTSPSPSPSASAIASASPSPSRDPAGSPDGSNESSPDPTPDVSNGPTTEPDPEPSDDPPSGELVAHGACGGLEMGSIVPNSDDRSGRGQIFVGTEGDDIFEGTEGDDIFCGLGGRDLILARAGQDRLYGGTGGDPLYGGRGHDLLAGHAGRDDLRGGRGRDVLRGGRAADVLVGGRGADRLFAGRGRDICRTERRDRRVRC